MSSQKGKKKTVKWTWEKEKKRRANKTKKNDYIGSPVCAHHTRGQVGTGQPLVGGIFFFLLPIKEGGKKQLGKRGDRNDESTLFRRSSSPLCCTGPDKKEEPATHLRVTWPRPLLSLSLILFLSAAQPPYSSSSSLLTQQSSAERLTSQSHLSFVAWLSA